MKRFIVLLLLIATAYAGSHCPTKTIKHCECAHFESTGDEDEGDTDYKCMHIGNDDLVSVVNILQNMTINQFYLERTVITNLTKD